ncbi:MAG: hypothetical protein ABIK10_01785, partial [candidate division WOR-3 bacterium]
MKYTITINQGLVVSTGLARQLDIIDLAIIDYLKDFSLYPKAKRLVYEDENYIWLNYHHLLASLPILHIRDISRISRRIKKLRELDLIKTIRMPDNTLYYIFTPAGYQLFF